MPLTLDLDLINNKNWMVARLVDNFQFELPLTLHMLPYKKTTRAVWLLCVPWTELDRIDDVYQFRYSTNRLESWLKNRCIHESMNHTCRQTGRAAGSLPVIWFIWIFPFSQSVRTRRGQCPQGNTIGTDEVAQCRSTSNLSHCNDSFKWCTSIVDTVNSPWVSRQLGRVRKLAPVSVSLT